jgi:hypothetical protein
MPQSCFSHARDTIRAAAENPQERPDFRCAVEETTPPPSLAPDPASNPPKETAGSSATLAPPDLDDIPAFLDRRRKSALADASVR